MRKLRPRKEVDNLESEDESTETKPKKRATTKSNITAAKSNTKARTKSKASVKITKAKAKTTATRKRRKVVEEEEESETSSEGESESEPEEESEEEEEVEQRTVKRKRTATTATAKQQSATAVAVIATPAKLNKTKSVIAAAATPISKATNASTARQTPAKKIATPSAKALSANKENIPQSSSDASTPFAFELQRIQLECLIDELDAEVTARCENITATAELLAMRLRQDAESFISRIPKRIQQMTMREFREKYNGDFSTVVEKDAENKIEQAELLIQQLSGQSAASTRKALTTPVRNRLMPSTPASATPARQKLLGKTGGMKTPMSTRPLTASTVMTPSSIVYNNVRPHTGSGDVVNMSLLHTPTSLAGTGSGSVHDMNDEQKRAGLEKLLRLREQVNTMISQFKLPEAATVECS